MQVQALSLGGTTAQNAPSCLQIRHRNPATLSGWRLCLRPSDAKKWFCYLVKVFFPAAPSVLPIRKTGVCNVSVAPWLVPAASPRGWRGFGCGFRRACGSVLGGRPAQRQCASTCACEGWGFGGLGGLIMRMSEGLILGFDLVIFWGVSKDLRRKCPQSRMVARSNGSTSVP